MAAAGLSPVRNLDADVVGARIAVLAQLRGDHLLITPGDQFIDQAVATGCGDLVLGEAETTPVVHVIGQPVSSSIAVLTSASP